jgi:serine/threonine protein kinase
MVSPAEWPRNANSYERIRPIGYGAFGTVYSAAVLTGPRLGQKVAIKQIDLEQFPDSNLEEIRKEIQIMSFSDHPNVIKYHV